MTHRIGGRLDRLERHLPPPPAPRDPDALTPEQLDQLPTDVLQRRLEERMARWWASPEGRAREAELAAMSDAELLAEWSRGKGR